MSINSLQFFPQFMLDNSDVSELLNVEQNTIDDLEKYIETIKKQLFINTVSSFIERYERILSIPVDATSSLEDRRSALIVKLNSIATFTRSNVITAIKEISTSSTVELIEVFNKYLFILSIIQGDCNDTYLSKIYSYLEEMKPSHLDYVISIVMQKTNQWHFGGAIIFSEILTIKEVMENGI